MTANSELDRILAQAKRDTDGRLVVAFLQNSRTGSWDCLVVAVDLQPLAFSVDVESVFKDAARDEQGRTMMVVVATPPGVEPAGTVAVPADIAGAPLASLRSVVSSEGYTMIGRQETPGITAPSPGPQMLRELLQEAAAQQQGRFFATSVETADGDKTEVLLDWSRRPLHFWMEMPGEGPDRLLSTIVVLPNGEGLVSMAVDEELRPLHSGEWFRAKP